jgi:hypothetical protein
MHLSKHWVKSSLQNLQYKILTQDTTRSERECWRPSKCCSTRASASACKLKASTRLCSNPRKQELIQTPRYNTSPYSLKSHLDHNIFGYNASHQWCKFITPTARIAAKSVEDIYLAGNPAWAIILPYLLGFQMVWNKVLKFKHIWRASL